MSFAECVCRRCCSFLFGFCTRFATAHSDANYAESQAPTVCRDNVDPHALSDGRACPFLHLRQVSTLKELVTHIDDIFAAAEDRKLMLGGVMCLSQKIDGLEVRCLAVELFLCVCVPL